jgi:hypothetical protein
MPRGGGSKHLGNHSKESTGRNLEARHENAFLIVVCVLFACVYLLEALLGGGRYLLQP